MSIRSFLVVASVGSLVAVSSLALAAALDAPGFYVPALLAILTISQRERGGFGREMVVAG